MRLGAIHCGNHHVVATDDRQDIFGRSQAHFPRIEAHARVVGAYALQGKIHLAAPNVALVVEDLAVQVRELDAVEVNDPYVLYTHSGEVIEDVAAHASYS